jgi:hypothetical protein
MLDWRLQYWHSAVLYYQQPLNYRPFVAFDPGGEERPYVKFAESGPINLPALVPFREIRMEHMQRLDGTATMICWPTCCRGAFSPVPSTSYEAAHTLGRRNSARPSRYIEQYFKADVTETDTAG